MSNLMMPSRVLLYGRKIKGIKIRVGVFDAGKGGVPGLGSNRFLREQFEPSRLNNEKPCFAMIYGFEYEGHYHDLMVPTIMLVHGKGLEHDRGRRVVAATAAAAAARGATLASVVAAAFAATDGAGAAEIAAATAAEKAAKNAVEELDAAAAARLAVTKEGATPESVAQAAIDASSDTGAAAAAAMAAVNIEGATPGSVADAAAAAAEAIATPATVAEAAAESSAAGPYIGRVEKPFPDFADNVRIWPYDKADYSMRLDPCSGPIESILLEAEIDDAELADEMAGRKVSGRKVGGYLGRGRKVSGRKVGISGRKVRGE